MLHYMVNMSRVLDDTKLPPSSLGANRRLLHLIGHAPLWLDHMGKKGNKMKRIKCFFGFHEYKLYSYQNGVDIHGPNKEYYHELNHICQKCGKIKTSQGSGKLTDEEFSKLFFEDK